MLTNRYFRFQYALVLLLALSYSLQAARTPTARMGGMDENAKLEYKANDMLTRGMDLLKQKQTDRGLKLLTSIPKMYPDSKTRFKVFLALGEHYDSKRDYELALKQYSGATESEEKDVQAEAYYRMGITHYHMNNFDKAFVTLRKVTTDYPLSVYANEAYYYIGMCHFKLRRWSRAVEALEMVGASVPMTHEGEVMLSEAGQRLYVKVFDRDLVILKEMGDEFSVTVKVASGDEETMTMNSLGNDGSSYIGSLPTEAGSPLTGDGNIQLIGGDTATVVYVDQNTEQGKRNIQTIANVSFVSTASLGFMDGAYRDYTRGIFGGQDTFLRVKDLDKDVSDQRDTITVTVYTSYKVEKEFDIDKKGVDLDFDEDEFAQRDSIDFQLVESGPHTGFFTGVLIPKVAEQEDEVQSGDDELSCMQGDDIVMEYVDETHIEGDGPNTIEYKGKILVGELQDVKIQVREVDSIELKARKALIESNIFLKLASIFKDVGLNENANEKATEGLDRADKVIKMNLNASLERDTVESAYQSKWELLLVQDNLQEAMAVCKELIALYPDSSLVDQAMMKIGVAKQNAGMKKLEDLDKTGASDLGEAIKIFQGVTSLEKSIVKPEAQYRIGEILEKMAIFQATQERRAPQLSSAMVAYRKCADLYPESNYAGDALEKVANYYIQAKDYPRAMELMDQIFTDFPDASFLDSMLLKWTIAAYRMGELLVAKEKCNQLLQDYPDSDYAEKAKKFYRVIESKLGG